MFCIFSGNSLISVNSVCGRITAEYEPIGVRVMCSPGPLEGNIVTVQKTAGAYLEMEELDVLVKQRPSEPTAEQEA